MDQRHTIIQGTWAYSAPRLDLQFDLVVGRNVSLRREPDNPHDRNAISVFLSRSKLGYLPRALAAELASYLDESGNYIGKISHVGIHSHKGKTYPSVYVDLILLNLQPPSGLTALVYSASRLDGERGVYRIRNIVDQRSYIGSSADVGKRLYQHITQLRNGVHPNHRLAESWRQHGPTAFEISLVERVTAQDLRERERFHIQHFDTHRFGYNQTADGEGTSPLPASERSRLGLDRLLPQHSKQSFEPVPSTSNTAQSLVPPPVQKQLKDVWCPFCVAQEPSASASRAFYQK
jgi:HIRAN domain/GIY-YIG catalytic domain